MLPFVSINYSIVFFSNQVKRDYPFQGGIGLFRIAARIAMALRWHEPIYMRVGYVFESGFFGRNDLTEFYEFRHP